MTLPTLRPGVRRHREQPSRLRTRVLACLAASPIPATTVELWLVCAPWLANGRKRVLQTLHALQRRGKVRRLAPLPRLEPSVGRWPARWVLVTEGDAS